MHLVIVALSLAAAALAQVKPTNPGFEVGELGQVPPGWFVPQMVSQAGFAVKLVDQGCRSGARCAMLTGVVNHPLNIFGNIVQTLPATGYTLRRVRLRSAIRVKGEQTRAQMWLRLDRADNTMAFLENMSGRPITSPEWNTYDIETDVPEDVSRIGFGVMLFGGGNAWVDDVSLDILDEIKKDIAEPARPLTERGLTNLTAFARLYGYVRFFHPSDQAARTDWDTFAIEGVRSAEEPASDTELAARLQGLFQPIAPTVQVFPSGKRPEPAALVKGPQIIRYKHNGVGLPSSTPYQIYKSEREKKPAGAEPIPPAFEAEVAPGFTARVPLALYADSNGTLPHTPRQPPPLYNRSAEDRGTRLGAVVIAWNVFQHFYPYFDVVKTDWRAELPKALRAAATDPGIDEFHKTLQRLVAALKDGHGRGGSPRSGPVLQAPLTLDWIEEQFTVTRVQSDKPEGIAPGDRVLSIDGKPVDKAAAEARALISGATEQWIRYRMAAELARCNPDTKRITLEVEPFARLGTSKAVNLTCAPPKYKDKDKETYPEPRPDRIAELEPGIFYVDLDRVNEADWKAVTPRLEKAKGIIFDMRGYPGRPGILALGHGVAEKIIVEPV